MDSINTPKTADSGISAGPSTSTDKHTKHANEEKNLCSLCSKDIGPLHVLCQCGKLFCAVHRYCDRHSCKFDLRAHAKGISPPVIAQFKLVSDKDREFKPTKREATN